MCGLVGQIINNSNSILDDVNQKNIVIGNRAFGKDSETVSKFISSAIRGFQTNGMVACAKHFPGHGSTYKDSHFDLPEIGKSLDELRGKEFLPFKKAIKSENLDLSFLWEV